MSGWGSGLLHNPGWAKTLREGKRLRPTSDFIQSMFAQPTARRSCQWQFGSSAPQCTQQISQRCYLRSPLAAVTQAALQNRRYLSLRSVTSSQLLLLLMCKEAKMSVLSKQALQSSILFLQLVRGESWRSPPWQVKSKIRAQIRAAHQLRSRFTLNAAPSGEHSLHRHHAGCCHSWVAAGVPFNESLDRKEANSLIYWSRI